VDPKLRTQNGWKAIVQKFKIKDHGLQKALVTYEAFDDDAPDDRLKALANMIQLAVSLMKVKEVAAIPAAAKYLVNPRSRLLMDSPIQKTRCPCRRGLKSFSLGSNPW
jgi:hypothetical protein